MTNINKPTAAQQEAREEELCVAQSASDRAFYEANPLSCDADLEKNHGGRDGFTNEQLLEFRLRDLAHLFHQAATDVLLVSKFPEHEDELIGRAYRHAALALMELKGNFQDADLELKQRLGAAA